VVADARAAAPDREDVAPGRPYAHVGERDPEPQVGRHRALSREEPLEERLAPHVGKLGDEGVEQLAEGGLERQAVQLDDAAAGDDLV
jgi:hypothetical protein